MAIPESWWRDWWEDDFSWEGLAGKDWEGWSVLADERVVETESLEAGAEAEDATLQDYWRLDFKSMRLKPLSEIELIASPVSGKRFTRMHLPLAWENGAPTGKADWPGDALDADLRRTLSAAAETLYDEVGTLRDADRRAQWQGAVLKTVRLARLVDARDEADRIPITVRCERAAFAGDVWFTNAAFAGDARFQNAAFAGIADFKNAAFAGDAWFQNAAFAGIARFQNAAFAGGAWFQNAAFAGNAWFESAAFAGIADFQNAAFAGIAGFENSAFAGSAGFRNAAFAGNAGFRNAAFAGNANFTRAVFARFANFSGLGALLETKAIEQKISARLERDDDRVEGSLRTQSAITPLARRAFKSIHAASAVFLGVAWFDNRDVLETSSFQRVLFLGLASFHGSRLHQGVSFHEARFRDALKPEKHIAAPKRALERLYEAYAHTQAAKAEDTKSFEDWRAKFEKDRKQQADEFNKRSRETKTIRYARLEDAFRTLKQAMEDNRNRAEEGRFFKLELMARRKRRDEQVPWWERVFSHIYEWISDYGNSIMRPMAWLMACIIPLFAILYALLGALPLHAPTFDEWVEAARYSCSRVFPFGPWGDADGPLMRALLKTEDGREGFAATWDLLTTLGVRLLASVQSVIALMLVFLTGLAVRRRFQIN